jgi:hypothetical protein
MMLKQNGCNEVFIVYDRQRKEPGVLECALVSFSPEIPLKPILAVHLHSL